MFLPMIVNGQKTQLGNKEAEPRKCSTRSSIRLKDLTSVEGLEKCILHFISNGDLSFGIYKAAEDPIVPDLHLSQSKAKGRQPKSLLLFLLLSIACVVNAANSLELAYPIRQSDFPFGEAQGDF
ncbi:hypothetical protein MTR67_052345 [Solanum verrucosum]|uniref:Uncharacterized protein n=1 Tax=Solanum verrucosum TaxID=315347 RepID=A0AAF0V5K6_SOLVR|nr:hypothetical protein MTR67_052345 [Solanum verrucosum]